MIKASDLRNLSEQELKEKLIALKKSLYEMRIKKASGRIEKPSKLSETRREIARVLTVLVEKEK